MSRSSSSLCACAAALSAAALLVGCSAERVATPVPPAKAPPAAAVECLFTEEPPTIDGAIDDDAWRRAVTIDDFSMPWLPGDASGQPRRPAKATRARLLWDRENLYVCADLDDDDLFADVAEHDGQTWDNDVFEVFLKPSVDKPAYYEFQVNARNTQFDCFIPRRGHMARFKRLHDFGIESAVKLRGTLTDWTDTDGGWSVEIRIPWSGFMHTGGRPEPGDQWRFALCRYDYDVGREKPDLSTTAPLSRVDFHLHEDYAPLVFVGPTAAASRPFGIPSIVPVTGSRVAGTPEPPPPYTVARALPRATLSCPITVAHQPGSDRLLYVTEPSAYRPSSVLRMRDDASSFEPELLIAADDSTVHYAITFHPDFPTNGYVYIGSNGVRSPDGRVPADGRKRTRITRYVIDRSPPYAFHADSATVIIEWTSDGHNGGDMAFGPDGAMYVGSGDGTSDSDTDRSGQDLTTLRAKILRIDVDHPDEDVADDGRHYSVPRDNPIFDEASPIATVRGARPETYAYGLRQPWRLALDGPTGRLWVGNQGQDLWEQVYLIERGANYGWSIFEGSHRFHADQPAGPTPFSRPVAEHPHAEARAMTGGIVYTGSDLPELRGAYLYADYSTGRIWGIRHDGTRVTWHELLADTPLAITALGADSRGELLICDHQPADAGGFYRLVAAPPAAKEAEPFPRKLSESGLFADVATHRMVAGVVPYEPASPLWSDGTHKARFFALPPKMEASGAVVPARIGVTNARGWNFPDGTVLVKSFAFDPGGDASSTRRWIETRFMVRQQGEWTGYSYEWNDEQTDAVLVSAEGKDRTFTIPDAGTGGEAGGGTTRLWHYPSRSECMVCHSRASNFVLGLCTVQLNRDFDYAAVLGAGHATDNQLRTLEHLGLLEVGWWADGMASLTSRDGDFRPGEEDRQSWVERQTASDDPDRGSFHTRKSVLLSRAPARTNRLVNPYDPTHPLEARARSYLHANCGSCHVGAGGGNALIDLEYLSAHDTIPLEATKTVGVKPLHSTFDIPDARLIAAGHPERSVLVARMNRRGPGQMPQLATAVVDESAVRVVGEWIESLAPQAAAVSAR